jgi:hypothetical protein
LAAYDPATHDGSVESVTVAVIAWLATREEAVPPITPKDVLAALPKFQAKKHNLAAAWHQYPPWADVVLAAIEVARAIS